MVMFAFYEGPPPFIPPHKGEGGHARRDSSRAAECELSMITPPSPLWGGIMGGGSRAQTSPACKPRNAA